MLFQCVRKQINKDQLQCWLQRKAVTRDLILPLSLPAVTWISPLNVRGLCSPANEQPNVNKQFHSVRIKAASSFRNGNLCWGPEGTEGTEYDPLYSEYVQGALVASHAQTS